MPRCFVVDAFVTASRFSGNPAAVVPLEEWPSDELLQGIAGEMNLSETAFFVGDRLRWFTPTVEVDLCGHATLASAFVVLSILAPDRERVAFTTRSGVLEVARDGEALVMDFPSRPPAPVPLAEDVSAALGRAPKELYRARDLVAVYEREEDVRALRPDLAAIAALDGVFAVTATAPGRDVDFVSRFFAPAKGVPEDPVTGSAHCTLTPLWAARLGKERLAARQISKRGGDVTCTLCCDRVALAGRARLVVDGTIHL